MLEFEKEQPEFVTPIWDYIAGLVDDERIADGRAAMQHWAQWLEVAEHRYGVPASVIAAVWGVEFEFWQEFRQQGRFCNRLRAWLARQARRPDYYRREFIAAMQIVGEGDADPANFVGSWAGAFGHTQFMPSTFLRLAVDLDGDGRRDVINSVPDALGSTANYLHHSGWIAGLPWGFEVKLARSITLAHRVAAPNSPWRPGRRAASPISMARRFRVRAMWACCCRPARQGPAFLVTRNFDAIYSYNAAESYALAIALALRPAARPGPIVTPWPTNDPGLSRAGRREVQALLIQRGYDLDGKIDGVLGRKTQAAIADFQARAGLKPDGRASQSVLTALRSSLVA